VKLKFLTHTQVQKKTGLGSTTIWRERRGGRFPEPYKLSAGRVGWREDELEEWVAAREKVEHDAA
jgi:prophage regulatory protein